MDHAAMQKKVKTMPDESLAYVREDLKEVIDCQEAMHKRGFSTPKLFDYWDEFHYVAGEIQRRKAAVK